jgi:hypothetical protein
VLPRLLPRKKALQLFFLNNLLYLHSRGDYSPIASGFVTAGNFMMMYRRDGSGEIYLATGKSGQQVFNREPRADAFFRFFLYKQPAAPFSVPPQCKSSIYRMHVSAIKRSTVFRPHQAAETLRITGFEDG